MQEVVPAESVDRFRRLARSSPWLWRSMRFTVDDADRSRIRAWIRRPDQLRVEDLDGHVLFASRGRPTPTGVAVLTLVEPGVDPEPASAPTVGWWTDPGAPEPERDADGLVIAPVHLPPLVVVDDPMWQNYRWVAMLNPRELADTYDGEPGVEIDSLAEVERDGRATLWATVRPRADYNPRCSCCPLLPSRAAVLAEGIGDPDGSFADAHRVALDVATGICVSARELGGPDHGRGFDLEIEAVDEELTDEWFSVDFPGSRGGPGRFRRWWLERR